MATATWTLHGSVRDDLGRGLTGALIDAGDFRTLSDGRGDFQLGGLRRLGESVQLDVIVSAAGHTREHRTFHDASRAAAERWSPVAAR